MFYTEPDLITAQQARDLNSMLDQCWATVADGDPTLTQHRIHVSCLRTKSMTTFIMLELSLHAAKCL